MDCSLLGFSVHGILQARILEWVVMPFSRDSLVWGGGHYYASLSPTLPLMEQLETMILCL